MMYPVDHSAKMLVVPITQNLTNGTIPFYPLIPLLFNRTGVPANLTTLAPHNHTSGSALPALDDNSDVTAVPSPSAISQGATQVSLVLVAILITVVFLAFIRSLCKKSNVWPFKKPQMKLDEFEKVIEVREFGNSVV